MSVADRVYLEKRLAVIYANERSITVQLKGYLRGLLQDCPDAFYVPVRMYAAFACRSHLLLFLTLSAAHIGCRFR